VLSAAGRELVPQVIHFLLRLAIDEQRDRRGELEVWSPVQGDELLSFEFEVDSHCRSLGAGAGIAISAYGLELRVLEKPYIEVCCLFGFVVEPQKRRDFLHGLALHKPRAVPAIGFEDRNGRSKQGRLCDCAALLLWPSDHNAIRNSGWLQQLASN